MLKSTYVYQQIHCILPTHDLKIDYINSRIEYINIDDSREKIANKNKTLLPLNITTN